MPDPGVRQGYVFDKDMTTTMNGRGDEIVDLANANLWC
jgi:hypothetical protein